MLHRSRLPRVVLVVVVVAAALALAPTTTKQTAAQGFTFPYNYMPSPYTDDGLFVSQAGVQLETLVAVGTEFELLINADEVDSNGDWQLGIFDGDTGKNAAGNLSTSFWDGHWDLPDTTTQLIFGLYADPDGDVDLDTATPFYEWTGNDAVTSYSGVTYSHADMPDNDWFDITMPTHAAAETPEGSHRYRLLVELEDDKTRTESSFKLRTSGRIRTQGGRAFQLVAPARRANDYKILYPDWTDFPLNRDLDPTTYDGSWRFYIELPAGQYTDTLDIWEGDWDFGNVDGTTEDTDDPDSPERPYFHPKQTGGQLNVQGAMGMGFPADDSYGAPNNIFQRSPSVRYDVIDPDGNSYANDNPSGNREWEKFTLSTVAGCEPNDCDHEVSSLPRGFYEIRIEGMDIDNINAILLEQDGWVVVTEGENKVGDTVWHDVDDDGILGASEEGIEGVTLTVYRDIDSDGIVDAGEPVVGTATTDANGSWEVGGLAPGDYIVEVDDSNFDPSGALEGLVQSSTAVSQTADGTNKVEPYVLEIFDRDNDGDFADDGDDLTGDFGYRSEVVLGDYVWYDANSDGVQDPGEDGIEGVTLELWRDDGDGVFDVATDTQIGSAVTDVDGSYLFYVQDATYFVALPDTEYDVGSGTLSGLDGTTANAGGDDAVDSDGVAADVHGDSSADGYATGAVTIAGADDLTNDFGSRPTQTLCFVNPDDPEIEANPVSIWENDAAGTVTVRAYLSRAFSDTAYGSNSKTTGTGWPGGQGRRFDQVVSSDNLQLVMRNGDGDTIYDVTVDLLSRYTQGGDGSPSFGPNPPPSGYATGGVGGEGHQNDGLCVDPDTSDNTDPCDFVLDARTSIAENLNNTADYDPVDGWMGDDGNGNAYGGTTNSPDVVDDTYDPETNNPDPPGGGAEDWIWDTWYEVTVDLDLFGSSGFGSADIDQLHSSPAKIGSEQSPVEPCP